MDRRGAVGCGCAAPKQETPSDRREPDLKRRWAWLRLALGVVVSGQLMVLSLAINLSETDADTRSRVGLAIVGLTVLGVAMLGPELWRGCAEAWRRRQVSLEAMFGLAFLGGLGASIAGLLTGGPVFFEVVTVVLCVYSLGRMLKQRFWESALARVERAGLLPTSAHRLDPDRIRTVEASSLEPGDVIIAYDGERLAAHGQVRAGGAWVDTSAVDGERVPRWVGAGDTVAGGAAVRGGTLRVEVDEVGASELARTRVALERGDLSVDASPLASMMARYFVPVVSTVAVVAGAGWTTMSGPRQGFLVATAVLLVACPCGFGLATPVSRWAATTWLAVRGVRVRTPGSLEALAGATTIVLDKTGTLTDIAPSTSGSADTPVARWVGAVQQWFDHPVARLLWRGGADAPEIRGARSLHTGGVAAEVCDEGVWRSIVVRPSRERRDLTITVDGHEQGVLRVEEQVKPGVPALLRELSELGMRVRILTGDTRDPGLGVAFEGGASPATKADRVDELRKDGAVVFVGDRPNDLPALARADVAVTVPGASPLVSEGADIVLADLRALPVAITGARAARERLRRLLVFSLTTNAIGVSVAAAGLLHPVLAAVIMAGTSLTVTLLALPRQEDPAAGGPRLQRARG